MLNIAMIILGLVFLSCTTQKVDYSRQPASEANEDGSEDQTGRTDQDTDATAEETLENPADIMEKEVVEQGALLNQWIHGSANCNNNQDDPIQVHAYNTNMYILRQNKCLNFEGPFMYLLFGEQKALLLDSGATRDAGTFPIQTTVETLMTQRYGANRANVTLVVAHSHGHGDHIAGDGQFQGQANTEVIGVGQAAVAAYFGVQNWPAQMVQFDLGNRVLDIIPIPGHQDAHIAIYDPQTQIVFTGDTLYPGRLYINEWETYRTSIKRVTDYLASKPVTFVLGAHIEMSSTPGVDYPIGTTFQPEEHQLQLNLPHLQLLNAELQNIGVNPMRKVTDSFIITP